MWGQPSHVEQFEEEDNEEEDDAEEEEEARRRAAVGNQWFSGPSWLLKQTRRDKAYREMLESQYKVVDTSANWPSSESLYHAVAMGIAYNNLQEEIGGPDDSEDNMFSFGLSVYKNFLDEKEMRPLSAMPPTRPSHTDIMRKIQTGYQKQVALEIQQSCLNAIRKGRVWGHESSSQGRLKDRYRPDFCRHAGDDETKVFPAISRVVGRTVHLFGSDRLVELDSYGRIIPPSYRRFEVAEFAHQDATYSLAPLRIFYYADAQLSIRFEALIRP